MLLGVCTSTPYGNNNSNNNRGKDRRRGGNSNNQEKKNGGDDDTLDWLKVACRDEWYQVHQVTTMGDVLHQLERISSSLTRKDLTNAKLLYRGKVLEDLGVKLKEQGLQSGDMVICVTQDYKFRLHEVLAMTLEIMSKELEDDHQNEKNPFPKLIEYIRDHGMSWDYWKAYWDHVVPLIDKHQISHAIRTTVDLSYHRLRMVWERPAFRRALSQPGPLLETYRKVLAHHLPKSIQKELSPSTKKCLSDPDEWKRRVQHVLEGLLKLGDVILDGMLDVVLDVVQGAGKASASSLSSKFSRPHDKYEPNMEDPAQANQMLFELSESEDES